MRALAEFWVEGSFRGFARGCRVKTLAVKEDMLPLRKRSEAGNKLPCRAAQKCSCYVINYVLKVN